MRPPDPAAVVSLLRILLERSSAEPAVAGQCLALLTSRVQSGEVSAEQLSALRERVQPVLKTILAGKPDGPLHHDAAMLAATLKDPAALQTAHRCFTAKDRSATHRLQALDALIVGGHGGVLEAVAGVLADRESHAASFRGQVLAALARLDHPRVGEIVLEHYPRLEPELQPQAIELLTQRTVWSRQLLGHIAQKKIPAHALHVNQVKRLLASKDEQLIKQVSVLWGTIREGRNPEREKIVAEMRTFLRQTRGDAKAGIQVFKNVCAQCHKIHGEGQEVGPDITVNGRSDFEQLLSNVFDPSLVIGAAYQATTVATKKGQIITGLVVEDSPQRIVLKVQGGKLETIARGDIDEVVVSKASLMPEGLEKQLKPQELADLFAFLVLDRHPNDPAAKKIPGAPK
jgi:putative heme-binding domain-containing protein